MAKKARLDDVGREIVKNLAESEIEELITTLKKADDLYYNDAESFFTDEDYDTVYRFAKASMPHHKYFTGVGSSVRGGKIPLPYQMGSLDQVYEGEIGGWVKDNKLTSAQVTLSDKLDGTSAMVIYDKSGNLQIAYSRGNGIEGADITRHIRHFVHSNIDVKTPTAIRGEVIFAKDTFQNIVTKAQADNARVYKNARNMVAGMMNKSKGDVAVYEQVRFVAYEIIGSAKTKSEQFDILAELGFQTPFWMAFKGSELNDKMLTDYIAARKKKSVYEIDGIVIESDRSFAKTGSRETLNPAHMVKYKVQDAENVAIAKVVNVEWNVSKHGYLKPRVEIEPVDLVGVTITHATGFNAKFINDNRIGPGAKVQITRSGDVIPFIQAVVTPAKKAQMPETTWTWNETGVDALTTDVAETFAIAFEQAEAFFASIDAPLLKKGNVEKLWAAGYDTIEKIIMAEEHELRRVIGSNGSKIYGGLRQRLTDIPQYKLMGSTTLFGRGVGVRKFKKLQKALGHYGMIGATVSEIALVEGFDTKTAEKIVAGMPEYLEWLETLDGYITFAEEEETTGGTLDGEKVVFTGFRNAAWGELVERQGGEIQSGVSGKTTILVAADPTSNSGKMKKARDKGVRIMGIDEFGILLGV